MKNCFDGIEGLGADSVDEGKTRLGWVFVNFNVAFASWDVHAV